MSFQQRRVVIPQHAAWNARRAAHALCAIPILACGLACGSDISEIIDVLSSSSRSEALDDSGSSAEEEATELLPWAVAPDFKIDRFASGLQLPVDILFVPNPGLSPQDPYLYVVERLGAIKMVSRNGDVSDYATGLVALDPVDGAVTTGGPGLGGGAVDPANGDLYITMLRASTPGSEAVVPTVEHLTSDDGGRTMATRTTILSMNSQTPAPGQRISGISFGPDDLLYAYVGDEMDPAAAQDLAQFGGKILRFSRDGAAAIRNPNYVASDGITARDYVFASGVRNPVGGAWRQTDRANYFLDNGEGLDRFARLGVGRNYGYDGSDQSLRGFALYNWQPARAPSRLAFVQQAVLDRSGLPAEYEGFGYVTQSGSALEFGPGSADTKAITEWLIDSRGNLLDGARPIAFFNGDGPATAAAIAAGPDGLYFSDYYADDAALDPRTRGASVLRLRYVGPYVATDCNANGVPDQDDIGLENDCNRNGIPDECDITSDKSADCDSNGILDECEIAASEKIYDFSQGSSGFSLNGSAKRVDGWLRLTPAENGNLGSAIQVETTRAPVDRLRAQFDFRIGNGSGADGLSFAILDAARFSESVLFGEEGLGAGSLVVKLNTFDNGDGSNNIQILFRGVTLGSYRPTFSIRDAQPHTARLVLSGGRLTLMVSSAANVFEKAFDNLEIPGYAPFIARVGFGARTGGLADEHWIDNVILSWSPDSDRNETSIPDACECVADVDDGQGLGKGDGQVTNDDLVYYVEQYIQGSSTADVDDGSGSGVRDGVVDNFDLSFFFTRFQRGC